MMDSFFRPMLTLMAERIGSEDRFYEHRIFCGFEIIGCCAFLERTIEAIKLLQASTYFDLIRQNLPLIRQAKRTGMVVGPRLFGLIQPECQVGEKIWSSSDLVWYASGFAHEAYHNILFKNAKRSRVLRRVKITDYAGTEAERKCLAVQLEILKELNAPEAMLRHVGKLMQNPTYQGDPTSLRDYVDRDW
jgi:hypothetical protein